MRSPSRYQSDALWEGWVTLPSLTTLVRTLPTGQLLSLWVAIFSTGLMFGFSLDPPRRPSADRAAGDERRGSIRWWGAARVDRHMPARVTYWTGIWDPTREAISKEVQTLRRAVQPAAPVVSLSAGQKSSISPRERVVRLAGARWMKIFVHAGVGD